jgi:type VI secretion system protein ImpM
MSAAAPQVGFFGKLPSHGDFVRRSLPAGFVTRWDPWLQAGLTASRQTLGDDWLERYLSGPIWRFALSGGVCGAEQWLGLMMPSVDRVGRYFPLTAATPLPPEDPILATTVGAESWLAAVEQAMLQAVLEDHHTADMLAADLAAVSPLATQPLPVGVAESISATDDGSYIAIGVTEPARLADAVSRLTEALATRLWGPFSLWWSTGSAYVTPSVRVCAGLPAEHLFWTLLSSNPTRPSDTAA